MDRLPTASTITQFPGFVQSFLLMASSFLCSTPGFFAGSPSKIVSILYICRDGFPLSFFHFQDLDLRFSSLLIVSSTSSHLVVILLVLLLEWFCSKMDSYRYEIIRTGTVKKVIPVAK